jgi:hypothetical protein
MYDEVVIVINDIADQLKLQPERRLFEVAGLGSFTLREAHSSWTTSLMLVSRTTTRWMRFRRLRSFRMRVIEPLTFQNERAMERNHRTGVAMAA